MIFFKSSSSVNPSSVAFVDDDDVKPSGKLVPSFMSLFNNSSSS